MSPVFIAGLVLFGIFALLMLGYINSQVEKKKLENARRRSDLIDRQSRLAQLSEGLPGQYLTVPFKQMLHELELVFLRGLLQVEAGDKKSLARAEELKERVNQGAAYAIGNPVVQLHSEEQLKEVRFQLESLHAQLKRAAQEQHLPLATAKQWLAHVQEQLIHLYLDFFHYSGQQQLRRGQPRQARLLFERAVTLVRRQQHVHPYKERLVVFEQLLEKTNAIVMEHNQQAAEQSNELSEAMGNMGDDDLWKKKQMYD